MRACGHFSYFKPVESAGKHKSPRPRPLISAIGGWKSENFWENLKTHAGGDDKQRIQFAPPNIISHRGIRYSINPMSAKSSITINLYCCLAWSFTCNEQKMKDSEMIATGFFYMNTIIYTNKPCTPQWDLAHNKTVAIQASAWRLKWCPLSSPGHTTTQVHAFGSILRNNIKTWHRNILWCS